MHGKVVRTLPFHAAVLDKHKKGGQKMADKTQMMLSKMKKAGKPVRPGDIVKLTGLDKDEVSKILNELKKSGKITSPKRCFYAPVD